MEFPEKLRELAARIPMQLEHIKTEEAAKSALVMPFLNALGYNVFDPREVTPELIADVGTKKGEKVDYAILKDGKPVMLFECKGASCNLDEVHASQLYRYFSVTDARIGVLTNGIVYRFFSDLEAANKMDSKPFFEVNMLALDELVMAELKKFGKSAFDVTSILATASELKYTREIKRILARELAQPSEDFVRFFTSQVYGGRMTQSVREQFAELTKRALQQFISERVSDRLKSALADEAAVAAAAVAPAGEPAVEQTREDATRTTEEELLGFYIVKAVVGEVVDIHRVFMRDQQSYCSVLMDDSNRKPICRLWFNTTRKHLGLFDDKKVETRVTLAEVSEIYRYAPQLKETVRRYLSPAASAQEGAQGAEPAG